MTIPDGAIVARFELRNADVGVAGDDFDMGIMSPGNSAWLYSGNEGSDEAVELSAPAAGDYRVCVAAYGSGNGGATMSHKLSSWVVTAADASSSLNVLLPGNVVAGGTATIGVGWSGLAAGKRYLGGFQLKDPGGVVQTNSVVRVDTTGAAPLVFPTGSSPNKTQ